MDSGLESSAESLPSFVEEDGEITLIEPWRTRVQPPARHVEERNDWPPSSRCSPR